MDPEPNRIRERRIAADDETTATLATNAGRDALAVAGLDPADLDLVIVATASPDYLMPATGVLVARDLGATRAAGFDLNAACSGFVFGLAAGASFVGSGMYRNVLVVGVDLLSRYLDWTDRNTCVLFGDGAGAVVLSASDQPGGLLGLQLFSDGTGAEGIIIPGGGTAHPRHGPDGRRSAALHAHGGQRGLSVCHPPAGRYDPGCRCPGRPAHGRH